MDEGVLPCSPLPKQIELLRRQKWWSNWTVQNLIEANPFQIKIFYCECIKLHHSLVLEMASSMHTTFLRDDRSCDICGRASEYLRPLSKKKILNQNWFQKQLQSKHILIPFSASKLLIPNVFVDFNYIFRIEALKKNQEFIKYETLTRN